MQSSLQCRGERVLYRNPLFGRLTKAGREYLLRNGWEDAADEEPQQKRLAFIWPNKSGPRFAMDDATAARVRPFPKDWTDSFDDKILLSRAMKESSFTPPCVPSPPKEEDVKPDRLYFVKHRYGAQGKSVYVYNKQELLGWSRRSHNAQDFVIQEEIIPSLYHGRKFVLRCHILMIAEVGMPLQTFVHKKSIICQPCTSIYNKGTTDKQSQVGQVGTPSILFDNLESDHPAAQAYDTIRECSKEVIQTVVENLSISGIAPETTCFALLGSDLIIDEMGNVEVCECNSHPALGWGTMSKVPSKVFSNLIEETLSILLLNGNEKETSFDALVVV